jgi:DNA-binding MarR family transcriptional regulator
MARSSIKLAERDEMQLLAKVRFEIRRFLQFSEHAALAAGLEPQQHQLLLQVAGVPDGTSATISHIARAMCLQHHSTVELSKRCESAGLVQRTQDTEDRRRVVVTLTGHGWTALRGLSEVHAQQLSELAPGLIHALTCISDAHTIVHPPSSINSHEGERN